VRRQKGPYRRVVKLELRGVGLSSRRWLVLECGHALMEGRRSKRVTSKRVTCPVCEKES